MSCLPSQSSQRQRHGQEAGSTVSGRRRKALGTSRRAPAASRCFRPRGTSRPPRRSLAPGAEASDPMYGKRTEESSTVETMFYIILDLAAKLSVSNTAKKKS